MARVFHLAVPTAADRALGAKLYEPEGAPRAQVIVHGATAVPAAYYDGFAHHLADRGLRVLTYDYRGIARSRSLPIARDRVTMADWIDDAGAAQAWLRGIDRERPLVAVGHSFGGQIAGALAPEDPADGLVLFGAQGGSIGRFPWPQRARHFATLRAVMPALVRTFGYLPAWSGIGEDLPAGVAAQWARWCLHPEYYLGELPWLRPRLAAYRGPVLALSVTDDDFAPLANVRWLLDRLTLAQIDHHHLRPADLGLRKLGHFGFFRPHASALWRLVDAFAAHVASDTTRWRPPALDDLAVLDDLEYGRPAA